MYRLIRPILFLLPPEWAHHLSLYLLHILPSSFFPKVESEPVELMGLSFPNRVGLAAGLDKNADHICALAKLGFGFIEVGTVTPKAQDGNPKPRLFRFPKQKAIINRMGFNNKGLTHLLSRLQTTNYDGILGVNIGKNKNTPLEKAVDDYLLCLEAVYPYASYVTVNLSSPNTPGLRELQHGVYLDDLLAALKKKQAELEKQTHRKVPLLVKIAPDLSDDELLETANALRHHQIEGIIASNTTLDKTAVGSDEAGGLSGAPLLEQSNQILSQLNQHLKGDIPIIAVGGITSGKAAKEKFQRGAHLVQLYTGLIYQGPTLVSDCIRSHQSA